VRVRFDDSVFDPEARELRRRGALVPLSPLAFELLRLLVEKRPRALSQSELKQRLWPDSFVGRTSLAGLVTEIRKAVGDAGTEPRLIRTHHGFGYSFCGQIEQARGAEAGVGYRLLWGMREIPIGEGEHVIGRGPDCTVRVDAPKTSRHHARIIVAGNAAVLEDLGSKNGTSVGGRAIEGRTALRHGDEIGIGMTVLIFLGPAGTGATETA
jgi:DNA-binding winged helix-turn-helix (wHTH) protein